MPTADDDGAQKEPEGKGPEESASDKIQKLAGVKAREYKNATITFNHILAALILSNPKDVDDLLGPKLKTGNLLGMIDRDLKNTKLHPQNLATGAEVKPGMESGRALRRAEVATEEWSSDRLFGAELLYAMLVAGQVDKAERSTTLDYISMALSTNNTLDAAAECRKLIDKFAAARGEKKQLTAGRSGQKNGDSKMPKSAYIVPLKKEGALAEFATNLNERAERDEMDPVVGRDDEINQVIKILARRRKNNPVLLGDAGVGKTAIVEGLVQRMNKGDVPAFLQKKNIIQLDLSLIVAGTKYRGQFEERLKNIMKELQELKDVIVFIDEIHTLMGAGSAEGSLDAANILKPALARGEITAIGSTTLNEYKKSIEKDAAMERRFQPVKVSQPDLEKLITMLDALKVKYEEFHGVKYPAEVIRAIADMSTRYLNADGNSQPDRGVTLMDDVGARAKLEERQPTLEDVASEIHEKTGIPVGDISEGDVEAAENLAPYLKSKVFHQNQAIDAFVDIIATSRSGASDENRPIGSFLWLGPTGVGKTELVKQAARKMFGGEKNIVRLDMSEYMEKHSVAKLIGSPPGYVGYEEGGQLTEKVRRNPYTIILLDEIEKAHEDVLNVMLQVLEDGRLTDGLGRVVDFKHTVIVMTSNATAGVIDAPGISTPGSKKKTLNATVVEALKEKGFKPEFINRVDEITEFNKLPKEAMPQIVNKLIGDLSERRKLKNLEVKPGPGVIEYMVEKVFDPAYGARPYKRLVNRELAAEFGRAIRRKELNPMVPTIADVTLKPDKSGLDIKFRAAAAAPVAASVSFSAKQDGLIDDKPVNDTAPPADFNEAGPKLTAGG